MSTLSTEDFLAGHPVFSLRELSAALGGVHSGTALERVGYHLARGRLKRVAKEVYVGYVPTKVRNVS